MKKCILALICLVLLFGVSSANDIVKEFPVKSGEKLKVKLSGGGSIDIQGWDEDKVSIEIDLNGNDEDDFKFDINSTKYGVLFRSEALRRNYRHGISLTARVPHKFNLRLGTDGGRISIENVEGDLSGSTGGGSIYLSGLAGEVDLVTGGGSVKVLDSNIDGEVTTGGGSVLVENVRGDFDARSGGGNVQFVNVVTPDREYPAGLVHIRNAGGALDVLDAPEGADVTTGGGDIFIETAGKFVRATTGGGEIVIEKIDGWVKARTGAGDIDVTMVGDPSSGRRDVTLITGHGDISLTVPKSLSMDIEIELAYTKNKGDRYSIKSDFDLVLEKTDRWDRNHGTARKYIYGDATIGDGEHKIKIRTTNGNVRIKQAD